jgi:hypothetical protein
MDKKACRGVALFIPYFAIWIGLFLFKSGWLAIGLYHAGMILFLILDRDRPSIQLILKGWNTTWARLLPFSAMAGLAIYVLWPWMQHQSDLNSLLSNYGLNGWKWIVFTLYFSLFHPVLEQFFWRGSLGHPGKKIRIEDAAFAGYHFFTMLCFVRWPWALLTFLILTGTAWVWRQCVRQTGGLLIAASTHLIADTSVILAVHWIIHQGA